MKNIIYLVKVQINKHGQFSPINYEHCPQYKESKHKGFCFDSNTKESCTGITVGKSLMKDINSEGTLLECKYGYG